MANNSIKSNARRLYSEIKQNISAESKNCLDKLLSLSGKELYEFRKSLLDRLNIEFDIVFAKTAEERGIDIDELYDELKNNVWGNQWGSYLIALEFLGSNIRYLEQDNDIGDNDSDNIVFILAHNLEPVLVKIASNFSITYEVIEFFLLVFDISGELIFQVDVERAKQALNGEIETDLPPTALQLLEYIVADTKSK